jgi:DUF917 family protein
MGVQLDSSNLPALASGCAALGSGGSGDPTLALLIALDAVERHGPAALLDVGGLDPEIVVLPCGMVGAPTIAEERIWNGEEGRILCEAIESARGRPVGALMAFHLAGAGGLLAVSWAARAGLPILDAEGMGRAFPAVNQQAMNLAGIPASPLALTDGRGNTLLMRPANDAWAARLADGAPAGLGGVCAGALYCMTGAEARRATIAGSVSLALAIGRAMETDPVSARLHALCGALGGVALIEGRIHDVQRRVDGRLVKGWATVVGTGGDAGRRLRIEFQSEFLLALEDGAACAAVPELISVVLSDSCAPVTTERLRQGQRVTVLISPAPEPWRSAEGLALVGPAAFGYDVEFAPSRPDVAGG